MLIDIIIGGHRAIIEPRSPSLFRTTAAMHGTEDVSTSALLRGTTHVEAEAETVTARTAVTSGGSSPSRAASTVTPACERRRRSGRTPTASSGGLASTRADSGGHSGIPAQSCRPASCSCRSSSHTGRPLSMCSACAQADPGASPPSRNRCPAEAQRKFCQTPRGMYYQ